ncbi:MAG: hypothetical protein AAFW75_29425, partial [Cyanobacteria bacterium J06636_16]
SPVAASKQASPKRDDCHRQANRLMLGAWATLLGGGWLPLIPTLLALGGSTLATTAPVQTLPTQPQER